MSPPATNARSPAPVRTMTRTVAVVLEPGECGFEVASSVGMSSALSTFGRLMVRTATDRRLVTTGSARPLMILLLSMVALDRRRRSARALGPEPVLERFCERRRHERRADADRSGHRVRRTRRRPCARRSRRRHRRLRPLRGKRPDGACGRASRAPRPRPRAAASAGRSPRRRSRPRASSAAAASATPAMAP